MLLNECSKCDSCKKFEKSNERQIRMKEKIANTPAKLNAPLSKTNPNHVNLALKQQRRKCTELEKKKSKMQEQINLIGVKVTPVLKDDVHDLMENNLEAVSPFMKLFWKEQKKYLSINPNARKYHPMIIRFCLSLAAKSPSTYDELRNSNILILPSRGTLVIRQNAIWPHAGLNRSVIDELIKIASLLKGYQRCAVLSFDEIKIHENLVFDKCTGDLIDYVDLGDIELNYGTFQDVNDLATHALVYYVRGIASDLKFSLAYFATKGVNAYQIMPTFWEAVAILELTCKLQVIACKLQVSTTDYNLSKQLIKMLSKDFEIKMNYL